MKVEISHKVDRVPGQSYNYLSYDFLLADCRVRARAYVDEVKRVSLLGRFNLDGSAPKSLLYIQGALSGKLSPEAKLAKSRELLEAMDARRASEFPNVLAYLRDRFDEIVVMGQAGPEIIATGYSPHELAAVAGEAVDGVNYQSVAIDVDLQGEAHD